MKRFFSQQGLSVFELMVVIGIIGILLGMAIPNFFSYRAEARAKNRLFEAEEKFVLALSAGPDETSPEVVENYLSAARERCGEPFYHLLAKWPGFGANILPSGEELDLDLGLLYKNLAERGGQELAVLASAKIKLLIWQECREKNPGRIYALTR